jgi:hypothetical protein
VKGADDSSKPERREGSRGRRVSEQRGPPGGGYDRDRGVLLWIQRDLADW